MGTAKRTIRKLCAGEANVLCACDPPLAHWPYSLFKGLAPILMKQVPYTVVQLTTFQLATDFAYSRFLPRVTGKSKDELSTTYASGMHAPSPAIDNKLTFPFAPPTCWVRVQR